MNENYRIIEMDNGAKSIFMTLRSDFNKEIKKMKNIIKGGKIEFNGEMFIIPNPAVCVHSFDVDIDDFVNEYRDVCKMNYIDNYDVTIDKLINIRVTSNEMESTNIFRGGFYVLNENGEKCRIKCGSDYIPARMLANLHENEEIIYRCKGYNTKDDEDVELIMHLKANQLNSCYNKFGNFESTFKHVTSVEV